MKRARLLQGQSSKKKSEGRPALVWTMLVVMTPVASFPFFGRREGAARVLDFSDWIALARRNEAQAPTKTKPKLNEEHLLDIYLQRAKRKAVISGAAASREAFTDVL